VEAGKSVVQLKVPEDEPLRSLIEFDLKQGINAQHTDYVWQNAGANDALYISKRVEVAFEGDELELSGQMMDSGGVWTSETGQISWDTRDSLQAVFTVNTPAAKVAVGYIGGKTIDLGEVTIAMDQTEHNWGTVTLTAMDGQAIPESSGILVVVAGRAENTDMQWNAEKTSVGSNWGTSPVRVEGLPVMITLQNMDRRALIPLDSAGNAREEIAITRSGNEQVLHLGAQHKTLWYFLTKK
jgi:hypothetical protein